MSKWSEYYLNIAKAVSEKSKDPSTKVGAVIVRPDNTIVSSGFNGFPKGANDHSDLYEDREYKLKNIIHAEINAILFARENLEGHTLYVYPFMPCASCAIFIAQAGIKKVIAPKADPERQERWKESFDRTIETFSNLGVELVIKEM